MEKNKAENKKIELAEKPKKLPIKKEDDIRLVRIMSTDIDSNKKLYVGLTKIKGISWSFSNAICKQLKLEKTKKIGSLTPEDIKKITEFIVKPTVPRYLINRRFDFGSGEDKHMITGDLDLQKEFDIKRLKKIKSYRGSRHNLGLPVRGQKTKNHFRKKRKASGMKKKKEGAK
ncbi:MAG: 30S ribosomal protein S13 [archaeon]|nr:30S ribosomal protein S13 [archaeon]